MACTSLVALPRACGTEGIVGGLQKVFIIAFNDLDPSAVTGEVYTETVDGIVSAITPVATKKFVEVGLLKSTAGIKETLTKNPQAGISYFAQEFTLQLSDLSTENRTFVKSVLNQPVAVIIRSRTGKYFFAGGNGQLELSALEGGTGVSEGDTVGYALTFSGIATDLISMVDPLIVDALIA